MVNLGTKLINDGVINCSMSPDEIATKAYLSGVVAGIKQAAETPD